MRNAGWIAAVAVVNLKKRLLNTNDIRLLAGRLNSKNYPQ